MERGGKGEERMWSKYIPCSSSELGYLHSFGDWDSGMQDVSEVHSPKELTVWNQIHLYQVDSGLLEIQSPYLMNAKRRFLKEDQI